MGQWIARKPIERPDGGLAQPGDPVPFAADWLTPQRWADHGYIEWVEDEPVAKPKRERKPKAAKVEEAAPAEALAPKRAPRKAAARKSPAKKPVAKSPAKRSASRKPAAAKTAAKTRRSA
jgi:hypothetical protein